jgi:hypothetical protein
VNSQEHRTRERGAEHLAEHLVGAGHAERADREA